MNTTIPVFLAANDGFSRHVAVVIASILANASSNAKFHFYILNDFIRDENKRKISALKKIRDFEIDFVAVDITDIAELPNLQHFSLMTYLRIKIPELFQNIDRAIYLDSDIVVTGDLMELWMCDLNGKSLGAVRDRHSLWCFPRSGFNAGILLMDLKQMRAIKTGVRLMQYIITHKDTIIFPDQDALNAVFCNDLQLLPDYWNYMIGHHLKPKLMRIFSTYQPPLPGIIHYVGSCKPSELRYRKEFKPEYWKYLAMTEYRDYSYEDRGIKSYIRYLLPEVCWEILYHMYNMILTGIGRKRK